MTPYRFRYRKEVKLSGTYDDDVELTLVGRVDKFLMSLIVGPFLGKRAFRNS